MDECGTYTRRAHDIGNYDVICAASEAGHLCVLDHNDLRHFDHDVPDDVPWLLGVWHQCGCAHPFEWPEVR